MFITVCLALSDPVWTRNLPQYSASHDSCCKTQEGTVLITSTTSREQISAVELTEEISGPEMLRLDGTFTMC